MRVALAIATLGLAAACGGPETRTEVSHATVAAAATTPATPAMPAPPPPASNCAPPPSELVVKDLAPGDGDTVRFRSAVLVAYSGWLYDGCAADFKGQLFDSSNGKMDLSFMVGAGRVIRGWDQGLIGMKEHGRRLLVIPPSLGYGAAGAGPIPPNSTLVFEVQLDRIIQQAPPQ